MVQVVPPHYRRQDNSLITFILNSIYVLHWPQAELDFLSIESSYLIYLSSLLFALFQKHLSVV